MSEAITASQPAPDNDPGTDANVVPIGGAPGPRPQPGVAAPAGDKGADDAWLDRAPREAAYIEYLCIFHAEAQFEACARWGRWSTVLGVLSAILGALTASAIATVLGDAGLGAQGQAAAESAGQPQGDWPLNLKFIVAVAALIAGVVAAAVGFLDPKGRAAQHGAAGKRYRTLSDEARQFRTLEVAADATRDSLFNHLQTMVRHRAEIHEAAPVISQRAYSATRAMADKDKRLEALAYEAGRSLA